MTNGLSLPASPSDGSLKKSTASKEELPPQMETSLTLVCPDCRLVLAPQAQGYACSRCGSNFGYEEGNILNFLPRWNRVGDEIIYRLADYKAQFQYLKEIRRFFYTKKLTQIAMSWGHKNVVHLIGKKVEGVSVDLGVGNGEHYDYIENRDALIGVDYDMEAMREIRSRGIKAKLFRADLTRLPFQDACFDVIRSTYAFEHLYYLEVCLEEIYRTLKNEGMLVASFPIVGGWLMDFLSRIGPQKEFRRKYGLNWNKILKVEHCNSSRRVLEAVKRLFVIDKIIWSPFHIPSHNLNMFATFKAHKNPAFL